MIAIIDYGLGNVLAFENIYRRLNIPVSVARTADDLLTATKLILPGVGAFDHAMKQLNSSGMRNSIEDLVLHKKMPILGICVGMQMLANSSDEGVLFGLGWINAAVKKFDYLKMPDGISLPHMGWNDVKPMTESLLFGGNLTASRFYFLHSYYLDCRHQSNILATTDYGAPFSSAVFQNNIYGVQFHPEKSHHFGIQLLKNFADL